MGFNENQIWKIRWPYYLYTLYYRETYGKSFISKLYYENEPIVKLNLKTALLNYS